MLMHRISPFDEMVEVLRGLDNWIARSQRGPAGNEVDSAWTPAAESFRRENDVALQVELPGVEPEKVQIDLTGQVLTISGEKPAPDVKQEGHYLQEIARGRFSRSFKLPSAIKAEDVKASFRNGVLEISLPIAGLQVSRRIPLQAADATTGTTKAA